MIILATSTTVGAKTVGVSLSSNPPSIAACWFYPDPRSNVLFSCGEDNTDLPAFVGAPVRFNITVLDLDGDNVTATFYFDYFNPNASGPPDVNPYSPVVNVTVDTSEGFPTYVEVNWTYLALGNFSAGANSSYYWVFVKVLDEWGDFGQTWFRVIVNENSEPFLDPPPSVISVSPPIKPQNPVIPLVYANISVGDPDGDAMTVAWDWGDGTRTVNRTPPTLERQPLNLTHSYDVALFPLNESPRDVWFTVTVWVDDGVGHNVSAQSIVEFAIDLDFRPSISVKSPLPGSRWKVNEPVPLIAAAQDREGDPIVFFWDFDNQNDTDGDGDPTRDRDANTNATFHAYATPGDYNATFWATDGENKKLCTSPDRNCTAYLTHWTMQPIPIQIRLNRVPVIALSNKTAMIGVVEVFRAVVLDPDGDSLNVTWIFGDGTANATNRTTGKRGVTEPFELRQQHAYAKAGIYNLTLIVSDGTDEIQETKEVFVESFNEPPALYGITVHRANGTLASNSTFLADEVVGINVTMWDFEGDALEVDVDWGDGDVSVSLVAETAPNCMKNQINQTVCSFSHRYADIGERLRSYTILVSITDHNEWFQRNVTLDENGTLIVGPPIVRSHTKNLTVAIFIVKPRSTGLGPWDLIDYTTLSVALGVPVVLTGRWIWKARKERKEE